MWRGQALVRFYVADPDNPKRQIKIPIKVLYEIEKHIREKISKEILLNNSEDKK
jgi:hypothetical protein